MTLLEAMEFWHWWILGLVLLVLEMLVAGTFFLWMAVATGVVGLLLLFMPELSWQTQWLIFGALSVVTIAAGRMWLRRHPIASEDTTLNRRSAQYVGRVLTLDEPPVNGAGKLRIDDTFWKVATVDGSDLEPGSKVRVAAADGTVLKIESA